MRTTILTLLSSVVFAGTAVYVAATRRHRPPWKAGVTLLLSCWILTFARGMRSLTPDIALKVVCYKLLFTGFAIIPTAFIWLVLHYAAGDRWRTRRTLALLSIVPTLTVALIWTNELHGWMWNPQSAETIVVQELFLTAKTAGFFYWGFLAYSYALLLGGVVILLRLLTHSRGIYGWQAGGLLSATVVAIGGASLDLFHLSPLPTFVTTGIGLSLGVLTMALTLTFLRRTDQLAATRAAVLDRIADAIIVVDAHGSVAEVNAAAVRFFPVLGPEAIGCPLGSVIPELARLPADDADVEVTIQCGETPRVFALRGKVDPDRDSRLTVRVIVLHDITEHRRSEEAIHRLNADLEQRVLERTESLELANRELEAFAYSVSHDLRAPLRIIDGHTHILVEDHEQEFDAETLALFEVIQRESCRMGSLIDSLLTWSRLSRTEVRSEAIDMKSMAAETFQSTTTADERRRIDFSVDDLPAAMGDPVLIRQIWVNLLSNAVKFSSRRERAVIEVVAADDGAEAVYSVRDNGVGFDDEYAGKLFGVFQRLQADPRFPGTGVGLAIVYRIVQRHGGHVWADSVLEKGATFHFALPKAATAIAG